MYAVEKERIPLIQLLWMIIIYCEHINHNNSGNNRIIIKKNVSVHFGSRIQVKSSQLSTRLPVVVVMVYCYVENNVFILRISLPEIDGSSKAVSFNFPKYISCSSLSLCMCLCATAFCSYLLSKMHLSHVRGCVLSFCSRNSAHFNVQGD